MIGNNEPDSLIHESDYMMPVHGEQLVCITLQSKRDLIADSVGQQAWRALLARLLPQAYRELAAAGALRFA